MKSAYKYDPLPMNGLLTRIIRLKPTTDPEAELQGEIFVANLDTAKGPLLRYEAISYTWEGQSPSPNHFIIFRCKDNILSRLNLTANTSAALRRVRLPNEVRYIWIDAICIDQSSIKDKERQIANMGFVYSLAQRVLVWLGDHVTRDGLLTLKYIRELAMHNPTDTDSGCQLQRVFDNIREDSKPQKLVSSGCRWSLMERFFCHPWFTRVWTLQEIALNPSSAFIYYGDETMEWKTITRAMDVMHKYTFDHYTVLYDALGTFIKVQSQVQRWRSSWFLDSSLQFLHFNPSDSSRPQLLDIFVNARNRESSEPKDSVFGLYGICLFLDLYIPPPCSTSIAISERLHYVVRLSILSLGLAGLCHSLMSYHSLLVSSQKYIYTPNQLRIDGRGTRYFVSGHNASMRVSLNQRLLMTSTSPFCKTRRILTWKRKHVVQILTPRKSMRINWHLRGGMTHFWKQTNSSKGGNSGT
ncbi:uncharacterized protein PAC_16263 [Phialocephala subalpina]|uniref:Heterokaryon incompatibility domain-containing protein n=1 Tax=Phialocephala subalpina TaxID=576137 RepID=A0A1L7XMU7_9HELO|nr:uncharacterized protein PAC_16263 [Phialocephala subalpina]